MKRSPSVAWIVAIVGLSSSSNELHISGKLKIMKTSLRHKCRVKVWNPMEVQVPLFADQGKMVRRLARSKKGGLHL